MLKAQLNCCFEVASGRHATAQHGMGETPQRIGEPRIQVESYVAALVFKVSGISGPCDRSIQARQIALVLTKVEAPRCLAGV